MMYLYIMVIPILCFDMFIGVLSLQVELGIRQCLISVVQFSVFAAPCSSVSHHGTLWRCVGVWLHEAGLANRR